MHATTVENKSPRSITLRRGLLFCLQTQHVMYSSMQHSAFTVLGKELFSFQCKKLVVQKQLQQKLVQLFDFCFVFLSVLSAGAAGYCGADPARPDDLRQEWCWLWGQSEPGELPFSYQLLPNSNVPVALTTWRIRVSHIEQKWLHVLRRQVHVSTCSLSSCAANHLATIKVFALLALWRQLKLSSFVLLHSWWKWLGRTRTSVW